MGLYDAVRREEKPRRRWHPMWVVALAFAAALVTALGLTISKPQRDHDRFIRCMSDISSSTTYAFSGKFTSLRARVDGQDLRITQENGYALYGKLFNMNATFSRDVPNSAWTTATGRCWSCGPITCRTALTAARAYSSGS